MYEGEQLRYGWIAGGKVAVPVPMLASQTLTVKSSKFVNLTTAGYAEYIDNTDDVEVFGHVESPYGVGSTTSGVDVFNCIIDLSAIFRIRIDGGTYVIGMLGDKCDIGASTANLQGADLESSSYSQLIIVGGDVANQKYVDVMINPSERGTTGI